MSFDPIELVKVKFELKCGAAAEVAHHHNEDVSLIPFIMSHAALHSMFCTCLEHSNAFHKVLLTRAIEHSQHSMLNPVEADDRQSAVAPKFGRRKFIMTWETGLILVVVGKTARIDM
jgi:hypothetical protein